MCGIAGGLFWGRVTEADAKSAVSRAVAALAHRGPDGHGLQVSRSQAAPDVFAVLGHTRLAILDPTTAGAQPMAGPDGSWIAYNGETYNFHELRNSLGASCFETRTDTEVLLHAYERWGLEMVPRLRGMFALGLWDSTRGCLVLTRDRLGIKPLYYFRGDGFLLFASEIRALLASGLVPRRLDKTALWQYLGYQSVPAPRTLIDGVRMLEPGHWMTIGTEGRTRTGCYWNWFEGSEGSKGSTGSGSKSSIGSNGSGLPSARQRVGQRLRDAVASHLVSDVPVGAFLSGGIDSSAVVALMREAGHTPRTFSVGFDEQRFDESVHARLVAERFRTEHTHLTLRDGELLDQLPAALAAMDQPSGDGINTFVISQAVRAQGVTVALSGLGGDEIFGGYPSFARLPRLADATRFWGKSPAPVRSLAATAIKRFGGASIAATKAAAVVEGDGSIAAMYPVMRQLYSPEERETLLEPGKPGNPGSIDKSDPYELLLDAAFSSAPEATEFSRIAFAESRTYMHDVLLRDTDQMSMAHGLEVRVPLLDHELVEEVNIVADEDKWAQGTPKRLLVESLGSLLPADIVHRPKQGFTLPFEPWMRGGLRPFCEAHLGDRGLAGRGLFRADSIRARWNTFLQGGAQVSWARLWILVVLDAWLERNGL